MSNDDTGFWVKVALSIVVVVVLGPLDVIGAGGVPLAPDKVLLALGAIWGVGMLSGGDGGGA